MSVVSDFSQMSPDELEEMVRGMGNQMAMVVRGLQTQLVEAQKLNDEMRIQLDEMTKSKPSTSPNDPEDPSDPDDEPHDGEPDEEGKHDKDDKPFTVIVHHNGERFVFNDISMDETYHHFCQRLQGKFSIPWRCIVLDDAHGRDEPELEEPEDELLISDFLFDGDHVEFNMRVLTDDCLDLYVFIMVTEDFGARRTQRVLFDKECFGCDLNFIISGAFDIPIEAIKTYFEDDQDVVIDDEMSIHFGICGRGGTLKKRRCSITELKVRNNDLQMVKDCFQIETFREEAWLDSLTKNELDTYYKTMKDLKGFPQQVQCTVDNVKQMKTLKVSWITFHYFFHFPTQLSHFPTQLSRRET